MENPPPDSFYSFLQGELASNKGRERTELKIRYLTLILSELKNIERQQKPPSGIEDIQKRSANQMFLLIPPYVSTLSFTNGQEVTKEIEEEKKETWDLKRVDIHRK